MSSWILEAFISSHARRLPDSTGRELNPQLVPVQLGPVQLAQQVVDLTPAWKENKYLLIDLPVWVAISTTKNSDWNVFQMLSLPIPASTWTKPKFLSVITSASTTRP